MNAINFEAKTKLLIGLKYLSTRDQVEVYSAVL